MGAWPGWTLLWPVFLQVAGAGGDQESGAAAGEEATKVRFECGHDYPYRGTLSCECKEGWKDAAPTMFVSYVEGRCTQLACLSETGCRDQVRLLSARCILPDCDCSCSRRGTFGEARASAGPSAGFQTSETKRGSACMGPLFVLSVRITDLILRVMRSLWKLVFVLIAAMLPFGQTHVRCSCYDPGMLRLAARVVGYRPICDGQCTVESCTLWMLYYDLAWSIYVLDVGIWAYCFLATVWLTLLLAWSIPAWLVLVLAVIGVFQCCDACLGVCFRDTPSSGPWREPFMDGPLAGSREFDCSAGCCGLLGYCFLCAPIARLQLHFPRRPANVRGGVLGYCALGSHPSRTGTYAGGGPAVDFPGLRGDDDLHDRADWREQVAAFLSEDRRAAAPAHWAESSMPSDVWAEATVTPSSLLNWFNPRANDGWRLTYLSIQGRRICVVDKPFDRNLDNCRDSSFEDYERGNCWICCDSREMPQWDLWLQCGHVFCSRCSEQMLQRRVPCPLCRQVSWNLKRGPAKYLAPAAAPGAV